jgi:hypothetical protein
VLLNLLMRQCVYRTAATTRRLLKLLCLLRPRAAARRGHILVNSP